MQRVIDVDLCVLSTTAGLNLEAPYAGRWRAGNSRARPGRIMKPPFYVCRGSRERSTKSPREHAALRRDRDLRRRRWKRQEPSPLERASNRGPNVGRMTALVGTQMVCKSDEPEEHHDADSSTSP